MTKQPKTCKFHVALKMVKHNSGARFHYDKSKERPIGFNNIYKRADPITWAWETLDPCGVCFECSMLLTRAEFRKQARFILIACADHMTLIRLAPMVKNPEIALP
jgi:hypothetical protein